MRPDIEIRSRIITAAQAVVQQGGYRNLTYDELAMNYPIGVASIEAHFPRKADLGAAVAASYRSGFFAEVERVEKRAVDEFKTLVGYSELFRKALVEENRMCLCGSLGAEISQLPKAIADEVRRFFNDNLLWLSHLLSRGKESGTLVLENSAANEANLFLATLEGAMLVARSTERYDIFDGSVASLLGRYQVRS